MKLYLKFNWKCIYCENVNEMHETVCNSCNELPLSNGPSITIMYYIFLMLNFMIHIFYRENTFRNKECSICMNTKNSNVYILHTCNNHYFHRSCLNEWYKISNKCPLCRK